MRFDDAEFLAGRKHACHNKRNCFGAMMMFSQRPITILTVSLASLLVCSAVLAQQPDSKTKTQDQSVKVDVNLVLVNATVSDPQQRLVTGLERGHFQLWEDKIEQKIEYFSSEDIPLSIGLIFDSTGSMSDKISTARDAGVTFVPAKNLISERFFDFWLRTTRQERHLECEVGVSRLNVCGGFDATIDCSPNDERTSKTPSARIVDQHRTN
jgi:hypothetical protein